MSQEHRAIEVDIHKMINIVAEGPLEQIKNTYPPSLLLTTRTPLGNSMLQHSVFNRKHPEVFYYLYNEVFKPTSPDYTEDSPVPLVIKAAAIKNLSVVYFLAAKGAELRPKIQDGGKVESRSVFGLLGYKDNELLYEQLLAIEARYKPTLNYVYTHNMNLIRKKEADPSAKSSGVLGYFGIFWTANREIKNFEPREIMLTLMTKPLSEVKKIPAEHLKSFRSEKKDTAFSDATALHFALKNLRHPDVFSYLYREIVNCDSPHRLLIKGVSLLVYAASFNNSGAITFLVQNGASLEDRDSYGKTALDIITACNPKFAESLTLSPLDYDDKKTTLLVSKPSAPEGIHKRTHHKDEDYGLNAADDLHAPLLSKISPSSSLSE